MARQYQTLQRSLMPFIDDSAIADKSDAAVNRLDPRDITVELKRFSIALPNPARSGALSIGCLVKKRYAWRGYQVSADAEARPQSLALTIDADGAEAGSLTMNFDSHRGLNAESLNAEEIAALRADGRQLSEWAQLTFNTKGHSRRILAWLFSTAYCYVRHISRSTDILIEANPRHTSFYRRALGFTTLGDKKICLHTNTPTILLRGNIGWIANQIEQHRRHPTEAGNHHLLYQLFPGPELEHELVRRLRGETGLSD